MIPSLQKFNSNLKLNLEQIKRSGCIVYITVERKTGLKFNLLKRKFVQTGYRSTGYLFLNPENGKYYESRDVRFNEKLLFEDKYNNRSINDLANTLEEVGPETFVKFDKKIR